MEATMAQRMSALQAEVEAVKNALAVLQNSKGEGQTAISAWFCVGLSDREPNVSGLHPNISAWFCVGLWDRGIPTANQMYSFSQSEWHK